MKTSLSLVFIVALVVASLALLTLVSPLCAVEFDFDDGTNQGWTTEVVAYDEDADMTTVLSGPSAAGWVDNHNYPNYPWDDPEGDTNGSAFNFLLGSQLDLLGLDRAVHDWVIVKYKSPDLSSLADWQGISSFSMQVLPAYSDAFSGPSYANLLYTVDDHDTGSERTFTDGPAAEITQAVWNSREFGDLPGVLGGASPPVTDYTTKHLGVNIWTATDGLPTEFGYAVDQVGDPLVPGSAVFSQQPVEGPASFGHISDRSDSWGQEQADNFSLESNVQVEAVRWWGSHLQEPAVPDDFEDSFTIRFFEDDGVWGLPVDDDPFAEFDQPAVFRTETEMVAIDGGPIYAYEANLSSPVSLDQDTRYHLSIVNETRGEQDLWLWYCDRELGEPGGSNYFRNDMTGNLWQTSGRTMNQTFELLDGPVIPPPAFAEMSTGSPVSMSQTVDTGDTAFQMRFHYKFESPTGELHVLLGDEELDLISAPGSLKEVFQTAVLVVDGDLLNQTDVELQFLLDGPPGSTLLLDNITFPGLVNGTFQGGHLNGWSLMVTGEGSIRVIPEPATFVLLSMGALALLACIRRKRGPC
jgi:hypothetical protein